MEALGPFHPQIVHTPIALIVFALLFDLVGRATDLAWWRKAATAMLVIGALGAWAAVVSGSGAEERVEEQGVPESLIGAHEDAGKIAAWLATGAVVARVFAGRAGGARGAVAGLGLVLHLCAAGAVGMAGFRGGKLVYEHGAGVSVGGVPVKHPGAGERGGAGGSDATEERVEDGEDADRGGGDRRD